MYWCDMQVYLWPISIAPFFWNAKMPPKIQDRAYNIFFKYRSFHRKQIIFGIIKAVFDARFGHARHTFSLHFKQLFDYYIQAGILPWLHDTSLMWCVNARSTSQPVVQHNNLSVWEPSLYVKFWCEFKKPFGLPLYVRKYFSVVGLTMLTTIFSRLFLSVFSFKKYIHFDII